MKWTYAAVIKVARNLSFRTRAFIDGGMLVTQVYRTCIRSGFFGRDTSMFAHRQYSELRTIRLHWEPCENGP